MWTSKFWDSRSTLPHPHRHRMTLGFRFWKWPFYNCELQWGRQSLEPRHCSKGIRYIRTKLVSWDLQPWLHGWNSIIQLHSTLFNPVTSHWTVMDAVGWYSFMWFQLNVSSNISFVIERVEWLLQKNVGCAQAQLGIEPCGHCTENSHAALLSGVGFVWTSPFNIVQRQSTLLDPGTIFKIDGSLNSHFSLANWLLALEHFKTFTETASNSLQVKLSTASSFKYLIISTVLPAESYVRAISVHFH